MLLCPVVTKRNQDQFCYDSVTLATLRRFELCSLRYMLAEFGDSPAHPVSAWNLQALLCSALCTVIISLTNLVAIDQSSDINVSSN